MLLGLLRLRSGRGTTPWPFLLLLLVVVILPTAGVLWFMSQAVRNESLATRQKLREVYQDQLADLRGALDRHWQDRLDSLEAVDPNLTATGDPQLPSDQDPGLAQALFAQRVLAGPAASVVVFDAEGNPAYPGPATHRPVAMPAPIGGWRQAETLEQAGRYSEAGERYAWIARRAKNTNLAAQALLAQARCLDRAGQTAAAITLLAEALGQEPYANATDSRGRLIVPSAQLRALQLMPAGPSPAFVALAQKLAQSLADYSHPIPAAQRAFLMRELLDLHAGAEEERAQEAKPLAGHQQNQPASSETTAYLLDLRTLLAAEELAQAYLASRPSSPSSRTLQPSGLPELWHLASPKGRLVALFETESLVREIRDLPGGQDPNEDGNSTVMALVPPGEEREATLLVSLPAAGPLQGWQLMLWPKDPSLFNTAERQQVTAYFLTGALVVTAMVLLAFLVVRALGKQLRLTRLKNDLLANVSHELKTPLASMRLLVDTLLETGVEDQTRAREYLALISQENLRLSRLVESFLTFSRLEQGKERFDRERVSATGVAEAAVAALGPRFQTPDCHFELCLAPDLPDLMADRDALVTVLLNLLDNAYKYSEGSKEILLTVEQGPGEVIFAVRDRGMGLSNRAARKIFDRFYQVDQGLSAPGGGCGLGLSIVRRIVEAHGGTVEVDSRLGEGSTFRVRLPSAPGDAESSQRAATLVETPCEER